MSLGHKIKLLRTDKKKPLKRYSVSIGETFSFEAIVHARTVGEAKDKARKQYIKKHLGKRFRYHEIEVEKEID
jgi:hypothetical protein